MFEVKNNLLKHEHRHKHKHNSTSMGFDILLCLHERRLKVIFCYIGHANTGYQPCKVIKCCLFSRITHYEQRLRTLYYLKRFPERMGDIKPKVKGS